MASPDRPSQLLLTPAIRKYPHVRISCWDLPLAAAVIDATGGCERELVVVMQGMDISESMLGIALKREVEGDLCAQDLGQGLPLRPGSFDGAISISAVQWLCNADSRGADPRKRMRRFFETLYASLARGGRAVLQVRREGMNPADTENINIG